MSNIEWSPETPDGWKDSVAAWEWREWKEADTHLGWRKWGSCPRCGDTMAVYQEATKGLSDLDTVEVMCNCTSHHANRPPTVENGCGAGLGEHLRIYARGGGQ
jgi:hypothetical protein